MNISESLNIYSADQEQKRQNSATRFLRFHWVQCWGIGGNRKESVNRLRIWIRSFEEWGNSLNDRAESKLNAPKRWNGAKTELAALFQLNLIFYWIATFTQMQKSQLNQTRRHDVKWSFFLCAMCSHCVSQWVQSTVENGNRFKIIFRFRSSQLPNSLQTIDTFRSFTVCSLSIRW